MLSAIFCWNHLRIAAIELLRGIKWLNGFAMEKHTLREFTRS
jgi:hypothetical protein